MDRKIVIRTIIFNFILFIIILLDLSLPASVSKVKKIESIYTSSTNTGNSQRQTIEARKMLELTNGELYRIGKYPEKDYEKGQKIKIIKSMLFNNVNSIIIIDRNLKKIDVGLFSNTLVFYLYIFSILVTTLNYFLINKFANIMLVASTMFSTIVSMLYIFYF